MTTSNSTKQTTGRLWYNNHVIEQGKPFPLLQSRKKELIRMGYDKKLFRISY